MSKTSISERVAKYTSDQTLKVPTIDYSMIEHYGEFREQVGKGAKGIIDKVRESIIDEAPYLIVTENYRGEIVDSIPRFWRMIDRLMEVEEFAFDTEFSSLDNNYEGKSMFVSCSFSTGVLNYYVPVAHLTNGEHGNIPLKVVQKGFRKLFGRKDVRIIGHNIKVELHSLANIGVEVVTEDMFDTMLAYWDINIHKNDKTNPLSRNGLKEITKNLYDYDQTDFSELLSTIPKTVIDEFGAKLKSEKNISLVDKHISGFYAMDDSYWTFKVYVDIHDYLEKEGVLPVFTKVQMPYMKVLFNMERRGIRANKSRLQEMEKIAEEVLKELEYEIYYLAGIKFSIGSPQQKAEILFGWEKHKLIFEREEVPVLVGGKPSYYKVGERKGQPKMKEVVKKDRDGNKIPIGSEFSGNKDLIEASFRFASPEVSKRDLDKHYAKGFPKGTTPQPSTSASTLSDILKRNYRGKRQKEGLEMIEKLLLYSKVEKLRGTYMVGIQSQIYRDGKTHGNFNQIGTTSGRLSANAPNLQNLPRALEDIGEEPLRENYDDETTYKEAYSYWKSEKDNYDFWSRFEIRSAFEADEGKMLVASDFSNLEMRILAHFSQDPLLLNMFQTGVDAHGDTAKNMFKLDCESNEVKKLYPHLRQRAKTINFLLVYGGGPTTLANSLGVPNAEGQELYDLYFATYKGVAKFIRSQQKFARRNGYVMTLLGRKQYLPMINSSNWGEKGYGERLAINGPIQGSGADIAILAQIAIENDPVLKELGYEQLLQVHDEVVGQCPEENVHKVMERKEYLMANSLPKKLNGVELLSDSDYGKSYADAK